jgi:dihydrofolate reductase
MSDVKQGIYMIWAMDRNSLIGRDNSMPWRIPAEMAYFRRNTSGHAVLMGRKTYESLSKKPLPNRHNVIITRDPQFKAEGCTVIHTVEEALRLARNETLFVMGGAEIYALLLPYADRLYVTHIDHEFEGDTYFSPLDWSEWSEIRREPGLTDKDNPYKYEFAVYERADVGSKRPI